MKTLRLTPEIRQRLAELARAQARHEPGEESAAVLELPKLALAEAVLAALPKSRPLKAALRFPRRRRA